MNCHGRWKEPKGTQLQNTKFSPKRNQNKYFKHLKSNTSNAVQKWVEHLSNSLEVLFTLQTLLSNQQVLAENTSQTVSKIAKELPSSKTLSQNASINQVVYNQSTTFATQNASYFAKPNYQIISTIEPDFLHSDLMVSLTRMFSRWYYKPFDLYKTPAYYLAALKATQSFTFKHHFIQTTHTHPAFSTC